MPGLSPDILDSSQAQLCPLTPLTPTDPASSPKALGVEGLCSQDPWACFLPAGVLAEVPCVLLGWVVFSAAIGTHLTPVPSLSGL